MKFLEKFTKNKFLKGGGFVFVEIRSELVDSLKAQGKELDETQRIQESRTSALNQLTGFQNRTIDEIRSSRNTETLQNSVRRRVLSVLGNTSDLTLNTVEAREYRNLIGDLDRNTDNAILTIDSVTRASLTLENLKKGFEGELERNINSANKERQRVWYKLFLGREKNSEQEILSVGGGVVQNLFEDLKTQLEAKKSGIEDKINENVSLLTSEYKTLNQEQKNLFQTECAREIGGTESTDPDYQNLCNILLPSLSYIQRLEVFKKANFNQENINQVLSNTANAEIDQLRTDEQEKRKAFEDLRSGFDLAIVKTSLKISSDKISPEDNLSTLLPELREFINHYGRDNREKLFEDFPDNIDLNNYQELLVYLKFIQKPTPPFSVDDMPANLKIKILNYIAFVEQEEGLDDDNQNLSKEFKDFEKNKVKPRIKGIRKLLDTGTAPLKDIDTLDKVDSIILKSIDDQIDEYLVFESEMKKQNFSSEEQKIIDKYVRQINELIDSLRKLQKSWEDAEKNFEEQEEKYKEAQKLLISYKDSTGSYEDPISGDKYKIPDAIAPIVRGVAGGTAIISNQTDIDFANNKRQKFEDLFDSLIALQPKSKDKIKVDGLKSVGINLKGLELQIIEVNKSTKGTQEWNNYRVFQQRFE